MAFEDTDTASVEVLRRLLMYTWVVFLHVLSAFAFVLAHGASATVPLVLKEAAGARA